MKLREYKTSDADIIAGWIRTEEELYRWSATIYGKYPIKGEDIDNNYSQAVTSGRFIPLTAVDENDKVVGHFIIRYPNPDDDTSVRIGFVVVDPDIRGKGYGRQMLGLGIEYIKQNQGCTRVDLGVFDNNPKARSCYESVGFKPFSDGHVCDTPFGQWHCTDMELFI